MSTFGGDLSAFRRKALARTNAIFHQTVFDAHKSITEGSSLTGSPGQIVDTARLRNSWQIEILSPTATRIGAHVSYARSIEDGVSYAHGGKPITQRQPVGGFHSVKLTVANFDRIVADVTRRVKKSAAFRDESAP